MSLYVLEGLRPWVVQRVSAVYITLFTLYLLYCGLSAPAFGFEPWRDWLFHPGNAVAVCIYVVAILFHAWIGMRDVVLDYVHNIMLRILVLGIFLGVLVGSGLWTLRILIFSVVS